MSKGNQMDEIMHVEALIQGVEGAIDLLEAPGSWTQHALARNGRGFPVSDTSKEATQYCIVGALVRAGGAVQERLDPRLCTIMDLCAAVSEFGEDPWNDLVAWNNDPERTQEDVQRLLRRTLERLRAGDETR